MKITTFNDKYEIINTKSTEGNSEIYEIKEEQLMKILLKMKLTF